MIKDFYLWASPGGDAYQPEHSEEVAKASEDRTQSP